MLKRAGFMFCTMFPILLILEYLGYTSMAITSVLACVTAGISVVIFPDPAHLKRLEEQEKQKANNNNEKADK